MLSKNERGFSFVEVLVSLVIVGIGYMGYMEVVTFLSKSERDVTDEVLATRVFETIINEIELDSRYITSYDEANDDYFLEMDTDDAKSIGIRCYSRMGQRVSPLPNAKSRAQLCPFLVGFYKSQVLFKGTDRIPVSRFNVKVRYFVGPLKQRRLKEVYLRPLVTDVGYY